MRKFNLFAAMRLTGLFIALYYYKAKLSWFNQIYLDHRAMYGDSDPIKVFCPVEEKRAKWKPNDYQSHIMDNHVRYQKLLNRHDDILAAITPMPQTA